MRRAIVIVTAVLVVTALVPLFRRNMAAIALERALFRGTDTRWADDVRATAFERQLRRDGRIFEADFAQSLTVRGTARFEIENAPATAGGPTGIRLQGFDALMLPGSYSAARFMTRIPRDGRYRISIRGQNGAPPPVLLLVRIGPAKTIFGFERGDGSWEEKTATVQLIAGIAAVDVMFLNDYFDARTGADRNAVVDWIELSHD